MGPLGILLFVLLSTIAAGGVAFALLQPKLAASKKVAQDRRLARREGKGECGGRSQPGSGAV